MTTGFPPKTLGMCGFSGSGKTTYLTVLAELFCEDKELTFRARKPDTLRTLMQRYDEIVREPQTAQSTRELTKFSFEAVLQQRHRFELDVYDFDGRWVELTQLEAEGPQQQLIDKVVNSDIFFFLINAQILQKPELRTQLGTLVYLIRRMFKLHPHREIPIALIITHADELPGFDASKVVLFTRGTEFWKTLPVQRRFEQMKGNLLQPWKSDPLWHEQLQNVLTLLREYFETISLYTHHYQLFFVSSVGSAAADAASQKPPESRPKTEETRQTTAVTTGQKPPVSDSKTEEARQPTAATSQKPPESRPKIEEARQTTAAAGKKPPVSDPKQTTSRHSQPRRHVQASQAHPTGIHTPMAWALYHIVEMSQKIRWLSGTAVVAFWLWVSLGVLLFGLYREKVLCQGVVQKIRHEPASPDLRRHVSEVRERPMLHYVAPRTYRNLDIQESLLALKELENLQKTALTSPQAFIEFDRKAQELMRRHPNSTLTTYVQEQLKNQEKAWHQCWGTQHQDSNWPQLSQTYAQEQNLLQRQAQEKDERLKRLNQQVQEMQTSYAELNKKYEARLSSPYLDQFALHHLQLADEKPLVKTLPAWRRLFKYEQYAYLFSLMFYLASFFSYGAFLFCAVFVFPFRPKFHSFWGSMGHVFLMIAVLCHASLMGFREIWRWPDLLVSRYEVLQILTLTVSVVYIALHHKWPQLHLPGIFATALGLICLIVPATRLDFDWISTELTINAFSQGPALLWAMAMASFTIAGSLWLTAVIARCLSGFNSMMGGLLNVWKSRWSYIVEKRLLDSAIFVAVVSGIILFPSGVLWQVATPLPKNNLMALEAPETRLALCWYFFLLYALRIWQQKRPGVLSFCSMILGLSGIVYTLQWFLR